MHVFGLTYMVFSDSLLMEFVESHQISVEALKEGISESHLQEILSKYCKNWRDLQPHLEVTGSNFGTTVDDERGKRKSFFQEWTRQKGKGANYFKLVSALLKTNCQEDASFVCSLLQDCKVVPMDSSHAASGMHTFYLGLCLSSASSHTGHGWMYLTTSILQVELLCYMSLSL